MGPRLYTNLLAAQNGLSNFVEQLDVTKLMGDQGADTLLQFLEEQRLSKTGFLEMPKAFDEFFEHGYLSKNYIFL